MKGAILVTAIVIFTFAQATNVNKKEGKVGRDPNDLLEALRAPLCGFCQNLNSENGFCTLPTKPTTTEPNPTDTVPTEPTETTTRRTRPTRGPAGILACTKIGQYYGGPDLNVTPRINSVSLCGSICQGFDGCRFYSIYLPGPGDPQSSRNVGDCILKGSASQHNLHLQAGFFSGDSNCVAA